MSAPLIGLFFGFLWLLVGAAASGRAAIPVIAGGALVFGLAGWRVVRRGGRGGRRFHRGYYLAAVAFELAAIVGAQAWLAAHGRAFLLFPVVGVIVGLHFIGLWLAAEDRRFLWLSGALVAINAAALLGPLAPRVRIMMSGFGSSAALLASAAA